jgi:hypothetical protein
MPTPISLSTLEVLGMETHALINELEDTFPPTNPHPDESIAHVMYRSGQRSVVEWIYNRLSEDNG